LGQQICWLALCLQRSPIRVDPHRANNGQRAVPWSWHPTGTGAPPQPSDDGALEPRRSLRVWPMEMGVSASSHSSRAKTLEPGQLCRLEYCRWRPGLRHHSSPNITGSGAPQPARLGKKLRQSNGAFPSPLTGALFAVAIEVVEGTDVGGRLHAGVEFHAGRAIAHY
jgi:hypothetical protein